MPLAVLRVCHLRFAGSPTTFSALRGPVALLLMVGTTACSQPASGPPAEPGASAPPSARELIAPSSSARASSSAAPVAAPAAEPVTSALIPASPSASAAAPAVSAPAASETPPRGKVWHIGLHIGGGPNDDVTKEPIRKSVQPHFEALRRCYGLAKEPKQADFGVDLRIPREGGRAQLTKPRSTLKDPPFQQCVEKVFEEIVFLKPRGGETVASYSLRFAP